MFSHSASAYTVVVKTLGQLKPKNNKTKQTLKNRITAPLQTSTQCECVDRITIVQPH